MIMRRRYDPIMVQASDRARCSSSFGLTRPKQATLLELVVLTSSLASNGIAIGKFYQASQWGCVGTRLVHPAS